MTSADETALLLGYMPLVVRAPGLSEWERKFAISIVGRSKRGPVRPTEKQIRTMRRLVDDFRARTMREEGE